MALSPAQLEHLEARLHEERARLLGQLHEFTDVESSEDSQDLAGDLSKFPTHPADIGTDSVNEELEASISTRVSAEIAEIDAALDRITTSPETFGLDAETGEPIPFERLDIIPYARIAVER
jgi:DnaK suppressor protein